MILIVKLVHRFQCLMLRVASLYHRAACLERDVACAQIQAQAAAIAQEREALAAQRMNAEVLTSLSEKVTLSIAVDKDGCCNVDMGVSKGLTCWWPLCCVNSPAVYSRHVMAYHVANKQQSSKVVPAVAHGQNIAGAVQVRDAAAANAERESRALAALERSSAERAAALVARERRLQEREEAVRYCDNSLLLAGSGHAHIA